MDTTDKQQPNIEENKDEVSRLNELLGSGYCREIANKISINIPDIITKRIILFSIKYKIIGCGQNLFNQLAFNEHKSKSKDPGNNNKICTKWQQSSKLQDVVSNSCNIYPNYGGLMILNHMNELYVCGQNRNNRLGYIESDDHDHEHHMGCSCGAELFKLFYGFNYHHNQVRDVTKINIESEPVAISKGPQNDKHTFVYCRNGQLYKNALNSMKVPRFWKETEKVVEIACGFKNTLFLTNIGNVYKCDEWDDGTSSKPVLVQQNIKGIAVGSYHVNMIGINGDLAYGNEQCAQYFKKHDIKLKYITAGSGHTLALSVDDKCYAFGVNESGQCGNGEKSEEEDDIVGPCLLLKGMECKSISAGSYHNMILGKKNNTVYSWGFNGQKQCSPTWDDDFILAPKVLDKEKDLGLDKFTFIEDCIAFYRESMILINPNKRLTRS